MMTSITSEQRQALRKLKETAEFAAGYPLHWTDSNDFGGASWAEHPVTGKDISVMVEPPEGTDQISGIDLDGPFSELDDEYAGVTLEQEREPSDVLTKFNGYVELTPTGAIIDPDVPFDLWEQGVGDLFRLVKALPWIVGDILLFGERRWGEMYAQAIEMTGLSYSTLSQYVRVAKAIPHAERRADIPWTAHKHTAALPSDTRQEILALAATGELENTDAVKERVRKEQEPDAVEERPPCPLCGGSIGKTRCGCCGADFLALVWHLHDLHGELRGFGETGEIGKLMDAILVSENKNAKEAE